MDETISTSQDDKGVIIPTDEVIVPQHRSHLRGGRLNTTAALALCMGAGMMASDPASQVFVLEPPYGYGPRPTKQRHRYRSGPCRICGKKDVRSGRERGVYLCSGCAELAQEMISPIVIGAGGSGAAEAAEHLAAMDRRAGRLDIVLPNQSNYP